MIKLTSIFLIRTNHSTANIANHLKKTSKNRRHEDMTTPRKIQFMTNKDSYLTIVCCIAIKRVQQVKCYLYFMPFTNSLKGTQSLRAI